MHEERTRSPVCVGEHIVPHDLVIILNQFYLGELIVPHGLLSVEVQSGCPLFGLSFDQKHFLFPY